VSEQPACTCDRHLGPFRYVGHQSFFGHEVDGETGAHLYDCLACGSTITAHTAGLANERPEGQRVLAVEELALEIGAILAAKGYPVTVYGSASRVDLPADERDRPGIRYQTTWQGADPC